MNLTFNSRIVSLLEIMETFSAHNFQSIGWMLGYGQGAFQAFASIKEGAHASLEARNVIVSRLGAAAEECRKVGLKVSEIHIRDTIMQSSKEDITYKEFSDLCANTSETVRRELLATNFFHLPPDKIWLFDKRGLFGESVSNSFPSCEYDISESGNCLALGRSTACVYHAMRVLEHGLFALGRKFKISPENKSWNDIIEPIEKEIRLIKSRPKKPKNWKREEQFYSEAAAQFMYFKNAWRNYTAHVQFKYTEQEAEAIFRHVRDFMVHISKKLKETNRATP